MELAPSTAAQAARRMAEHAEAHALPEVRVVLHGGEPLLLGPARMRETLALLTGTISPVTRLDLRIHTNAVRLDEEFLDLFAEYGVKVGVSLDGDQVANDRHRLFRNGRSSHPQVLAALERLRRPEYRHLYAGLLCTIDIGNEPVAVYRGLLEQQPPRVDLLLPHATWEHQPYRLQHPRDPRRPAEGAGEYARWLGAIFDVWDAEGRPTPIRTFESVLGALYGRPVTTETLGLDPVDLLVIETDGTLEQVDALKTAYDNAAATGLDVWRNALDEAAAVPGIAVRQQGLDGLSEDCRACPVVRVCGGGHYPHRYRPETGFDNPSVYCADLKQIIEHVAGAETSHGRGLPAASLANAVATAGAGASESESEALATAGPAAATSGTTSGTAPSARTAPPAARAAADDVAYPGLDLREADFEGLAAGYGSAAAVAVLSRNQEALRRDMLALIARQGPQQDRRFGDAWDLLAALDNRAPDAVNAVLAEPYVRTWAVKLLLDLRQGAVEPQDAHHLEAIAAAAALRAAESGFAAGERLPVPVRGGVAPLPGFGALAADGGDRVWCVPDVSRSPVLAQPLRRFDAAGLRITLEDTDPYRVCHGFASRRQSDAEAAAWATALDSAVRYIDEHLPAYAAGLRAGLTTIMPMQRPEDGTQRSAAARQAFGAVGVALPDDPALLALLLVHEFQHVKLGALLDIAELFDQTDTRPRHYAPWRPDPRPLEGLLQGTYAHIAVVEFWRDRRSRVRGAEREVAETQFARWRTDTAEAVVQLRNSGSLTPLGMRLAEAMGHTLDPWLAEPVSPGAEATARHKAGEHRAGFEERLRASVS